MCAKLGKKVGLLGTVHYDVIDKVLPAERTTPGPKELAKWMAEIKEKGGEGVVLEVSSHALDQERVASIHFDGAILATLDNQNP